VVSIAIAFIAPFMRDIGEVTTVAMNVLFWFTPVIYSISALPKRAQAWAKPNPFYIMIHPIQMIAFEHVFPGPEEMLNLFALTLASILFGYYIYKLCRTNYVYY